MDFHERKQARKNYYEKYVKGWKQRPCIACNGSGYYDHNGSPKCSACEGTGKETYKPNEINNSGE
jgi:DnaJ-class molecular chaperone